MKLIGFPFSYGHALLIKSLLWNNFNEILYSILNQQRYKLDFPFAVEGVFDCRVLFFITQFFA